MNNRVTIVLMGVFSLVFATTCVLAQSAGGYAPGEMVTNFSLKDGNGHTVSLTDYTDKPGVVILFLNPNCPFSNAYTDRLMTLDRQFAAKGWPFLAIVPGDVASPETAATETRQAPGQFPYLADPAHRITGVFGASRDTPGVFAAPNRQRLRAGLYWVH